MVTKYLDTPIGCKIAYDVDGDGQGLILLHGGFNQSRTVWREFGYVDRFKDSFYKVITIDFPGHGESLCEPMSAEAFDIDFLVEAIRVIAKAEEVESFSVFGFSLGGSVALQLAARLENCTAIIVAGSYFGNELNEYAKKNIADLIEVKKAVDGGYIDQLGLSEEDLKFVRTTNLDSAISLSEGMSQWPVVMPESLRCPAYVYVGSLNKPTLNILEEQAGAMAQSGIRFEVFEGLGHEQEVSEIERVGGTTAQ